MRIRKKAVMRLLTLLTAAAVSLTALPVQLPTVLAEGGSLIAGLPFTTDIPDAQFIYGSGPVVNPVLATYLTDGAYDEGDFGAARVVGFNTPGYLEFDMGEEKTFRQVKITSATEQSFATHIDVFSQMKIAVYTDKGWEVVCDAQDLPYESNHTYVLGCMDGNSVTGSKIRFYFAPGGGLKLNVFNELEVLEEAPEVELDGVMESVGSQVPEERTDFAKGLAYETNWQDSEYNGTHNDPDHTKLTDDATATSIWSNDAIHYKIRANGDPVIFTFDLKQTRALYDVEIVGINEYGAGIGGAVSYKVEYFDPAANNWILACQKDKEPEQLAGVVYDYTERLPDAPVLAQKVRVSVTPDPTRTFLCLTDIKIWGDAAIQVSNAQTPSIDIDLPKTAEGEVGSPFTLEVEASVSDGGTLSYQWMKDGEPVGENSPSYTIDEVAATDAGSYQVKVTNTNGGDTADAFSQICTVEVTDPNAPAVTPVIGADLPERKLAMTGDRVSFTISASVADKGTLSYQWYKDDAPIGTNNAELVIDSASLSDSGNYRVVVTNTKPSSQSTASSAVCALTVTERLDNMAEGRPYTTEFASADGKYYDQNGDDDYELTDGVVLDSIDYLDPGWTGLVQASEATFTIDLGESAVIHEVKTHVFTHLTSGITPPQGYTVQVSNDGFHWETVHNDQNLLGDDWLVYIAPSTGIKGRFVKVTMKTGWFLFLDEIEIWGKGGRALEPEPDPNTVANQAKGKAYYLYASDPTDPSASLPAADSAAWPDDFGTLLTDGVVDALGDWEQNKSQWVSWQKENENMDITAIFDLSAEKAIHEISACFVQDAQNGVALPASMRVYVGTQAAGGDINWMLMQEQTVSPSSQKTETLTYTPAEAFRTRYVKLVFKQTSDYMGLGEIQINGKGNTAGAVDPVDLISQGLTKLSNGKEYTLSDSCAQYPDTNYQLTDGNFASGGDSDKAWTGFSFTPSGGRFVTIDLGDTYMVSKWTANLLTGGASSLPRDIQFSVSQDKENWTTVYSVRNPQASGDRYKAQAFLGTPIKARYVICYLYADSGVSLLDEIEVFGDPTPVTPDHPPVNPPTPPVKEDNYLIPGEATGGIKNLAIIDTSSPDSAEMAASLFDGAAVTGDPSAYHQVLSALNSNANPSMKVVLSLGSGQSLDTIVSQFDSGAYDKLTLTGILLTTDQLSEIDTLAASVHAKGLKVFWAPSYNTSGIANWKEHGIDAAVLRPDGSSNVSKAAETALKNGLGLVLDAKTSYDEYLKSLDAAVSNGFDGKYVFRAYDLGAVSLTDEQNARMTESTKKLMKGTLKASNRNASIKPVLEQSYSTWISLKEIDGYEYSKDGLSWTIDPVFTGLSPETGYTFYQRIKETHLAEAALMSEPLAVTTPKVPADQEPSVPTITTDLSEKLEVKIGGRLTLTVAANGNGALSYQWYKGDTAIDGATNASYTIASATESDAGSYKVVVMNTLNGKTATATSRVCTVTITAQQLPTANPVTPVFTENLASTSSVRVGSALTLTVVASVSDDGALSYQWYKNNKAISDANSASYTIDPAAASDSGNYKVTVSNTLNGKIATATSQICIVTVLQNSSSGNQSSWGGGSSSGSGSSSSSRPNPGVSVGGWKQLTDGSWQYLENNKPISGWKTIESAQYYFNSSGLMQTGWLKDGKSWYYLKDNGQMATGWIEAGNTWYYLTDNGKMATGWLKQGSAWYYLSGSGAMKTGWLQLGNDWYYLKDNGAMQTGWLQLGNNWYYLKGSGAMQTGWNWIQNNCYYFNASGQMAKNTTVNGYKLDANGAWVR